jgi:hypothetical protein
VTWYLFEVFLKKIDRKGSPVERIAFLVLLRMLLLPFRLSRVGDSPAIVNLSRRRFGLPSFPIAGLSMSSLIFLLLPFIICHET